MSRMILGPLVGGVGPNSANLWGRADAPGRLYAWLGRQPDLSDAEPSARSKTLTPENGFCGVAPLHDLESSTTYHYALTLEDAPPSPLDGPYPSFKTFPEPGSPVSFRFAFGSCYRPPDDHSGGVFEPLLAQHERTPFGFLLMVGDQIYADQHRGNGIGKIAVSLDDYRALYRYTWDRPVLRRLFAILPVYMAMDDHDIDDDWRWADLNRTRGVLPWWNRLTRWLRGRPREERQLPRSRVLDALQAYWEHQAMHGSGFIRHLPLNQNGCYDLDADPPGSLAYTFEYGAAAFFVMDTPTMRVRNLRTKQILDAHQWRALENWLDRVKDDYPIKFIVSSGAVIYRVLVDPPADRWSGYPRERKQLLRLLADRGIEGVYILTGDLHTAHAIRADLVRPDGSRTPIREFCATPFDQDPSWLSRFLYNPFGFGPVRKIRRQFTAPVNNFGLVQVNFPEIGTPQVGFEVYGESGQLLGKSS